MVKIKILTLNKDKEKDKIIFIGKCIVTAHHTARIDFYYTNNKKSLWFNEDELRNLKEILNEMI